MNADRAGSKRLLAHGLAKDGENYGTALFSR
jgi:hypothetical protein